MVGSSKADVPLAHLGGSALAAVVNFPLWKASAMAQSGFKVEAKSWYAGYVAAMSPPYRGAVAVVAGMTWARAAIFGGSEMGGRWLRDDLGYSRTTASVAPALVTSTLVQIINQPVVRGSITLQDPACPHPNLQTTLAAIAREKGVAALWRGTSAGVMKTVPKYCTAIFVKDAMEHRLPKARTEIQRQLRSAAKAATAAVCGAVLTNPLDVIRNEMFKSDRSFPAAVRHLAATHPGGRWLVKGADKNIIAVAVPVACTLFFTEQLGRIFIQR